MTLNHPTSRSRRAGFTLMELMVSVAILLAILSMVGVIFSTASRAGGNATAMAMLHRQLAQVSTMIEQDLARTDTSSILGIAGKEILAFESTRDRDAAKPQKRMRADLLMVFTQAEQEPYLYQGPESLHTVSQVVYGHADFGQFDITTGAIDLSKVKSIENPPAVGQPMPASDWHLARRVVHFLASLPVLPSFPLGTFVGPPSYRAYLTSSQFLTGQADTLYYRYDDAISAWPTSASLVYQNGIVATVPWPVASDSYLFYGGVTLAYNGGRWWMQSGATGWTRTEDSGAGLVPVSNNTPTVLPPVQPGYSNALALLEANTFYAFGANLRRTVIDPKPPLSVSKPMASYFLPNCSEFKVEFTYDDPRELPFDAASGAVDLRPYPVRWQSVPSDGQILWRNQSVTPSDRTDPRRWPRAIRITLKAWDSGGRLTDPVTRTIVHAW
jgi:prepilin-type N-terminal cleavage/methylation domain-containing protein